MAKELEERISLIELDKYRLMVTIDGDNLTKEVSSMLNTLSKYQINTNSVNSDFYQIFPKSHQCRHNFFLFFST